MSAFTADPTIRRRGQEGQLWVIRVVLTVARLLRVYPD